MENDYRLAADFVVDDVQLSCLRMRIGFVRFFDRERDEFFHRRQSVIQFASKKKRFLIDVVVENDIARTVLKLVLFLAWGFQDV